MKVTTARRFERIDDDWAALLRLSEEADVACVICMDETPSGLHIAAMDGKTRQYNPITSKFE